MEKINVAGILKSCPSGMELDCTICEDIYFDYVDKINIIHCYIQYETHKTSITLNQHGAINSDIKSKCVIFPKGKTTWEGFVPPCQLKIEKGKWYVCIKDLLDNYANKAFCKGDIYLSTQDGSLIPSNSNVPFEVFCPTTYFRDWTIQDAKDGDVIFYDSGWTCIFKCIHGTWYSSYCFITHDGEFNTGYEEHAVNATINGNAHLATPEQCNLLFQKMKESGYKWNPKTKTLEKLIPEFKDGDVIVFSNECYAFISIFKENASERKSFIGHCWLDVDDNEFEANSINFVSYFNEIRFATKREKKQLFRAIENNGYKWNDKTKNLEKLIQPKFNVGDRIRHKDDKTVITITGIKDSYYLMQFYNIRRHDYQNEKISFKDQDQYESILVPNKFNINTLKPFKSEVLVRNDESQYWIPAFWGCKREDGYVTTFGWCRYCIPYEGNEHLLETNNDCEEYFKTWK